MIELRPTNPSLGGREESRPRDRWWCLMIVAAASSCGTLDNAARSCAYFAIAINFAIAGSLQADDFNAAGWRLAQPGYHLEFPRDHGPHFDYQTEWWYLTGNLRSDDGHEFGYELTFFRHGYRAPARRLAVKSRFVMNEVKFAHFTITDFDQKQFHVAERVSRGAFGDAGFLSGSKLVWISDWHLDLDSNFRVEANDGEQGIQLDLRPEKHPVLQGKDGFSQKAAGDGHASYYYSVTRLETQGTLRDGGKNYHVTGLSWFDREWATNQLTPEQVGWNWFALQFADGTDLMLYQIRRKDGTIDPYSVGKLVDPGGAESDLSDDDFVLQPTEYWTGGDQHARYPIRWRLRIRRLSIDVEITTPVTDQELNLAVRYWEGAIRVDGTRKGNPIRGVGYMELTGYAAAQRQK
jgi:predicted secreted hydrolase